MLVDKPQRWTFTIQEVAKLLGIGRTSAYEAVRRGEIPVIHLGRRLLVSRKALERLLEGTTLPADSPKTQG